jgi:hypothetical protein
MHSVFALSDRCRLKENFVRRTTDTNRIVKQPGRACLVVVAVLTLVTSPASLCLAQPVDTGLPKDFRPPPPTPKEFAIEKPLITADDVTDWKPKRLNFQSALGKKLAGNGPKIIDEGFRIAVHELSIEEKRDELTDVRKAVIRYIDNDVDDKNEETKKFACKTVVKHAAALLDGNFHVRMQAVLLIGSLNISPQVPGLRPKPAVAYIDGLTTLLDVIQAPEGGIDQPEPVRILAAMGATRLLKRGRHTLKVNSKIPVDCARRMLAELEGNGTDWYHQRLIEALAETALSNVPNAKNQQEPVIAEALARILANPRRSNQIRARAARLLGRVPMPGSLQAAPIAYSIIKLTQKIATEVNQRRVPGGNAIFRLNDIYLAFKADSGQLTTDGRKQAGLLSTLNQKPIQAAYKDILPIVQSIFRQFQAAGKNQIQVVLPVKAISKLDDWPKPDNMALAPGRPSIDTPLRMPKAATPPPGPPQAARQGSPGNQAS